MDKAALANVGYARVSMQNQDLSLQLDALSAAECGKTLEERASGARAEFSGLQAAPDCVRDGEVLVIWRLDRFGRSLPYLIEIVAASSRRPVEFRSLTETIDTTTPGGRFVFHIFGTLGQSECDLIQEHTRPGLAAAATRARQNRPQVRRQAEVRTRDGRQGLGRARDRNVAESGENGAL